MNHSDVLQHIRLSFWFCLLESIFHQQWWRIMKLCKLHSNATKMLCNNQHTMPAAYLRFFPIPCQNPGSTYWGQNDNEICIKQHMKTKMAKPFDNDLFKKWITKLLTNHESMFSCPPDSVWSTLQDQKGAYDCPLVTSQSTYVCNNNVDFILQMGDVCPDSFQAATMTATKWQTTLSNSWHLLLQDSSPPQVSCV
jgi:hypothetical protein